MQRLHILKAALAMRNRTIQDIAHKHGVTVQSIYRAIKNPDKHKRINSDIDKIIQETNWEEVA